MEWLESLVKGELELSASVAAGVEREVMGDTVEGIFKSQVEVARDRYRRIL